LSIPCKNNLATVLHPPNKDDDASDYGLICRSFRDYGEQYFLVLFGDVWGHAICTAIQSVETAPEGYLDSNLGKMRGFNLAPVSSLWQTHECTQKRMYLADHLRHPQRDAPDGKVRVILRAQLTEMIHLS